MASTNLHEMMMHLHKQGVINLDVPIRELVQQEVLNEVTNNGLPTDILIGPRYFFVTRFTPQGQLGINQVLAAARGALAQHPETEA